VSYEDALPYASGGTRWVIANYVPDTDDQGEVSGFFALVTDITERKQAEEEIQQRNRELAALFKVSRRLAGQLDVGELLDTITRSSVDTLPAAEASSLWLYDEKSNQLVARAWAGHDDEAMSGLAVSPDTNLVGLVWQTGQPQIIDDVSTEPAFEPLGRPAVDAIRSVIGVPLMVEEKLIGALFADNYSRIRVFGEHDLRLLQSLANQAAIAIENARLFEAERDQRELAEALRDAAETLSGTLDFDEVLDGILAGAGRVVSHDVADILMLDSAGMISIVRSRGYAEHGLEEWTRVQRFPLADFRSLRGIVESGQPIAIPDTQTYDGWVDVPETRWIRSYVCAPIRMKGRIVGFISLSSTTSGTYTSVQAQRLQSFANQAAIAIENARLFEEVQAGRERLRDLAGYLQTARETERTHIAQEIHDEFGQALTALKMDLSWLSRRLPADEPRLAKRVGTMSKLIDSTVQMVRRVATELRPGLLDDLGLVAALEWQAEEFAERSGIDCELHIEQEEIVLHQDLATALFRIFQESLTNVARHAQATEVHVALEDSPHEVVLIVRDNGKGITKDQVSAPQSLGLIGIQERAHFWGGDVTFEGIAGQGTTVTVRIPRAGG
jgi:signal transduction histidine kinase